MVRTGFAGTKLNTAADNYFIVTNGLGSVSAATATNLPVDSTVKVIFAENSTTYYSAVKDVKIPCGSPFIYNVELGYVETSAQLYAENANGQINSDSVPQPFGANDEYEVTICMKAGSDKYWGNPDSTCENIGVIEFDKTYIRKVEGPSDAAVPGFFTYVNSSYDGAGAFVVPKIGDGTKDCFNVKITGTSSDFSGLNHPILRMFDCNIDKDERTLDIIEGVEDEEDNMLSLGNHTLKIYLS
jgi:hypothetical protein